MSCIGFEFESNDSVHGSWKTNEDRVTLTMFVSFEYTHENNSPDFLFE